MKKNDRNMKYLIDSNIIKILNFKNRLSKLYIYYL